MEEEVEDWDEPIPDWAQGARFKRERDEWRDLARRLARIVEAEKRFDEANRRYREGGGTSGAISAAIREMEAARAAVTADDLACATAAEDA